MTVGTGESEVIRMDYSEVDILLEKTIDKTLELIEKDKLKCDEAERLDALAMLIAALTNFYK